MKIKLELFGASREFSDKDYLEFNFKENISISDFRKEIILYINRHFRNNENFKKIVETSAFCNEDNNIIEDNHRINKDQKISIIPPIGGG